VDESAEPSGAKRQPAMQQDPLTVSCEVLTNGTNLGGYLNQFHPTVNCTVLIPGLGVARPALEMCS
jgi:hypothetical protein